jgi:hypothetical protein
MLPLHKIRAAAFDVLQADVWLNFVERWRFARWWCVRPNIPLPKDVREFARGK